MSVRSFGFDTYDKSHVMITGFKVQKQTGDFTGLGAGIKKSIYPDTQDITVSNNEVTLTQADGYGAIALGHIQGVTVSNNYVHDILGDMRGIQITSSSNVLANGNTLRNIARTGLYFAAVTNGRMSGNVMTDSNSTHGNGLTVYQGSNNVTIDGNLVIDANIAFTMESSSNVTIVNNVFDGSRHTDKVFADWGSMTGANRLDNNTIIGSDNSSALSLQSAGANVTYTLTKNVIEGAGLNARATYSGNIYTELGHFQSARYGWAFGPGEQLVPASTLFVAPGTSNYHVRPAYQGFGASL
jgi:hypothetical protein